MPVSTAIAGESEKGKPTEQEQQPHYRPSIHPSVHTLTLYTYGQFIVTSVSGLQEEVRVNLRQMVDSNQQQF